MRRPAGTEGAGVAVVRHQARGSAREPDGGTPERLLTELRTEFVVHQRLWGSVLFLQPTAFTTWKKRYTM